MRLGKEIADRMELADRRPVAELARKAERAGCFLGAMLHDPADPRQAEPRQSDRAVALPAAAVAIERIRIGPMVTTLPRQRPPRLAWEAVTLDHGSGGRLSLGVGLGDPSDEEFGWFGEPSVDHRTWAVILEERSTILGGPWRGEPFGFAGEHS